MKAHTYCVTQIQVPTALSEEQLLNHGCPSPTAMQVGAPRSTHTKALKETKDNETEPLMPQTRHRPTAGAQRGI